MSEETKHTPGPWAVETVSRDETTKRAWVWTVREYPQSTCVAEVRAESFLESELLANARLIAAAPDLLKALRVLVADEPLDHDSEECTCCFYCRAQTIYGLSGSGSRTDHKADCEYMAARNAIAKATGQGE